MKSMSDTRVSVIIPVYNQAPYLAECIDSVLAQTLHEIEVVCVDDGSTDGSGKMLDEYAVRDSRVKVIHQENAGAGPARNAGMDAAQGEFIAFMDPDDKYPDDGVLADLVRGAEDHGVDVCGGSMVAIDGSVLESEFAFVEDKAVDFADYQFEYGYVRFIFGRSFLKSSGVVFPPLRRFQDVPFFVEAMHAAARFYALRRAVYSLRPRCDRIDWAANECAKGRDNAIGLSMVYGMAVHYGYERMASRILRRMSDFVGSLGWDICRLRDAVRDRDDEIDRLRASESYRVGLAITWPLRKLHTLVRGRR